MKLEVALSLALAAVVSACGSDNGATNPPSLAAINGLTVVANPNNVLSAILSFTESHADSGRVEFWTSGGARQVTPYSRDIGNGSLLALGLKPSTAYSFDVQVIGPNGITTSDTVAFTTAALPTFLASASITSAAPASFGYIITALFDGATAYVTAFDSTGQVAWYRAFEGGVPAQEIKQQLDGHISAILTTSHGGDLVEGHAVDISPDGTVQRTFSAPIGSYFDGHEFWELYTSDGSYAGALFYTYTARHLDLSASGGPADTLVSGHQLVTQAANGDQSVVFDAWDHFRISDNVEPIAGQLDFDHPNALSISPDGNYVTSWRNLDVIVKIDATTGAVIWKLASPLSAITSDFTIAADPLDGFSSQHGVRAVDDTHILIFDNGTRHSTPASRALEYNLDSSNHTATMVFQFAHTPPYFTQFTGSVQRFDNGNTLIGWTWGAPLVATEVNGTTAVWEGTLEVTGNQVPYRFTKIRSLYGYQKP